MKNGDNVILLAEDALLREGVRHLLLNLFPSVTQYNAVEMRNNLFTHQVRPRCLVIVPSTPFISSLVPLVSIALRGVPVIMLCPDYATHYWAHQILGRALKVVPLQLPVSELMWELKRAVQNQDARQIAFNQAHQRWLDDVLLRQILTLTRSEAQVLYLLLREYTPATIGRLTSRDMRTVSAHKVRAMAKLALTNHTGLSELASNSLFLRALELELLNKAIFIPPEFYFGEEYQ